MSLQRLKLEKLTKLPEDVLEVVSAADGKRQKVSESSKPSAAEAEPEHDRVTDDEGQF